MNHNYINWRNIVNIVIYVYMLIIYVDRCQYYILSHHSDRYNDTDSF